MNKNQIDQLNDYLSNLHDTVNTLVKKHNNAETLVVKGRPPRIKMPNKIKLCVSGCVACEKFE